MCTLFGFRCIFIDNYLKIFIRGSSLHPSYSIYHFDLLQGQLSFTDYSFSSSMSAVVVTNPIDVRFSTLPNSVDAVKRSTHIRVLVFRFSFYFKSFEKKKYEYR